jgi:hypothetical protein
MRQRLSPFLNRWTLDKTSTDYLGIMASLCPVLYGNVTVLQYDCDIEGGVTGKCYLLRGSSSQVLQTGLGACGAFERSWWSKNMGKLNATHQEESITFGNAHKEWLCRNGSVAAALEDLAANVTIGMFGVAGVSFLSFPPLTPLNSLV